MGRGSGREDADGAGGGGDGIDAGDEVDQRLEGSTD